MVRSQADIWRAFSGLKANTRHVFGVRSKNERVQSDFSERKEVKTKGSKKSSFPGSSSKKSPDGKVPYTGLDPINASTGGFLWSYTLLEDYGKEKLDFTVMYDSTRSDGTNMMGRRWSYSFGYQFVMVEEYAYFMTPYDEVIPFGIDVENESFHITEDTPKDCTIEKQAGNLHLINFGEVSYQFEILFSEKNCQLNQIYENGRLTYNISYNTSEIKLIGVHGGEFTLNKEVSSTRISSVKNALTEKVDLVYDGDNLSSIVNMDGKSISFTYDEEGNLLTITDFVGKTILTNQYDWKHRIIAQGRADGEMSYAEYDDENGITTFIDESGGSTKYHYDDYLHVTKVESGDSHVENKYNAAGQITEQVDCFGNSTKIEYDENGYMTCITYPDLSQERIGYDNMNHPVKMTNRDGTESLYQYDEKDRLVLQQDECGNISYYNYHSAYNDLLSYKDKNENIWEYNYDEKHHLKQAKDPEGYIYGYVYDDIGRMISYLEPDRDEVTYSYSSVGDMVCMTDGDGSITFEYDDNGNQISMTDRMGHKKYTEYSDVGLVLRETDFMGNAYAFSYDVKGNLIQETDSLNYIQRYTYDLAGNMVEWKDQNGNATIYSFNAANQLTEVKDAALGMTKYSYDVMGQVTAIIDPRGNTTSYIYDVMGRTTSIVNALGYNISYTYDKMGNVLTKTDENGNCITYTYDKNNQISSITTERGTVFFTYDKMGRVVLVQDVDGYDEKSRYRGDGNVIEVCDKEENKTFYSYDGSGRLIKETDPNGNETAYEYDRNGNCTKVTDANKQSCMYEYNANNQLVKQKDPMGYETLYAYSARGELITVRDARGGETFYEYDGNGNLTKERNPLGGSILYSYDALNRLKESVDEEGKKQIFEYDANGNMTSYVDANGNCLTYSYDALNRIVEVIDKGDGHIVYEYTKTGEIKKVVDQEGAETNYSYDTLGRVIQMSDALDNSVHFVYDNQDRIISETDARGNTREYKYSKTGKLVTIKDPEGNETAYSYDALGQMLSMKDAIGNVTSYEYDALGQVIFITDALGHKTSFMYTIKGEISQVTDANGGITYYSYDACGNLIKTVNPLGGEVTYEYDALNNQILECAPSDAKEPCITLYYYDKKSRIIREINPLHDEMIYSYDGNDNIVSILDEDKFTTTVRYDWNNKPVHMQYSDGKEAIFRYNKRGELVELKDWNGTVGMDYDKMGRLTAVKDPESRLLRYGYDANGNNISITYPDHSVVSYSYDKNNHMTTVIDGENETTQYTYNPLGMVSAIEQPSGSTSYTYDACGQPNKVVYDLKDGKYLKEGYSYDVMGNLTERNVSTSAMAIGNMLICEYDIMGHLTYRRDRKHIQSYRYSAAGNRISYKEDRVETLYEYNANHQLIKSNYDYYSKSEYGVTYNYKYDRRGNLVEESLGDVLQKLYTYDARGHMVHGYNAETGEATEYTYNALDMRVKNKQKRCSPSMGYLSYNANSDSELPRVPYQRKENSYVVDYLKETNPEMMSYEKDYGVVRTSYGLGHAPLSQKVFLEEGKPKTIWSSIASEYGNIQFHSDLLGSPQFAMFNNERMIRYAERDVWGDLNIDITEDLNSSGIEKGLSFANYRYDPVIEKYFAQARFYDAKNGRMLGVDPVRRSANGYPYCDSNPVNRKDPTGEIWHVAAGALVGGLIGAAGSVISQKASGKKVNLKKVVTSAAKGAITGGVYAANPVKGVADAFLNGAVSGAASAVVDYLMKNKGQSGKGEFIDGRFGTYAPSKPAPVIYGSNTRNRRSPYRNTGNPSAASGYRGRNGGGYGSGTTNPQNTNPQNSNPSNPNTGAPNIPGRNPNSNCGGASPWNGALSYAAAQGYQCGGSKGNRAPAGGFSAVDFIKDVARGAVVGGLTGVAFYGVGKVAGALGRSVRSARSGNKGGSKPENIAYRAVNQKDYDRYSKGLGLEAKNPNGNWGLKEHLTNGSGRPSWSNDPYISTTTDLSVAQGFNNSGSNLGIAVIDMNKVPSATYKGYEIFPRTNGVEGLPYHYSFWQQEISVHKRIPFEAIKDFIR